MDRFSFAAVAVVTLAILAAIIAPVYIVTVNSTQRLEACVESGGAYVNVANTSRMECRR